MIVARRQISIGRLLRSIGVALIPVVNLMLFATFAIYAGNPTEFSGAYVDLVAVLVPYAALLLVVLAAFGLSLGDRARTRFETVLCALAVLIWVQGNILVWNYGVFDGSSINWLDGAWRGVLDLGLWLALLLLAVYRFEQFGRGFLYAAIASLVIQFVAVGVELNSRPEILESRDVLANIEGRDAAMRFSETQNIVHIVMDGFQSDIFTSILDNDTERNFKNDLRGFTYFKNHLGAYPYTQLTLPAMLSGRLYFNDEPVDDFVRDAIEGPTVVNSAAEAGYEIDIMAPVPLKNVYAMGAHHNSFGITTNGHVTAQDIAVIDAARLIDLALFRVVPHFGKALVHRDELWVFQGKVQSSSWLHLQYFSDLAFLKDLATEMTVDRQAPVYKMIHVMLSHRPIVGNERCEFDGRKRESREAVTIHAQCGFVAVLDVLQRMKDLGIYDSSLIVLMADHGAWVPVEKFKSDSAIGALSVAMATPVFAVKPPHTNAPFRVSESPTAMTDVPDTIAAIAGFDADFGGESAFELDEDAERERRHLIYGFGVNPEAEGFLFPMQEWIVNGDPYLAASWRQGDRHLPRN